MMISLDNLAHRYGILPSEALARGSSYDFKVMAVSTTWSNKQREQDNVGRGNTPYKPLAPTLSKEEMIKMMNRAKEIQKSQYKGEDLAKSKRYNYTCVKEHKQGSY